MDKCLHTFMTITEFGEMHTQHTLEDGEWWHNNEPGCYGPTIRVECYQCGLSRLYSTGRMPHWLRARYEEAMRRG